MNNLVWSDEFDGSSLDYSKWECQVNAFGGGNNELQLYTDRSKNVRVENGCLVLEAHREHFGIEGTVREFTSGRVRTKHRGDGKYGRYEIRAKLPVGQGIWPAIWMLPTDEVYGPWAASGEIDIMEAVGRKPHEILGTLHFGDVWPKNAQIKSRHYTLPDRRRFCDDFHVFALEWTAEKMRWFVDDHCYGEASASEWHSRGAPSPAPFDQRFHMILNIAVGGKLCGNPDHTTVFPQRMLVDYVRVYQ